MANLHLGNQAEPFFPTEDIAAERVFCRLRGCAARPCQNKERPQPCMDGSPAKRWKRPLPGTRTTANRVHSQVLAMVFFMALTEFIRKSVPYNMFVGSLAIEW